MSGGKFSYADRIAWSHIFDELQEDMETTDPDKMERALALQGAAEVFFAWLKEYDLAACGDTSWETYDKKAKEHMQRLTEIVKKAQSEP